MMFDTAPVFRSTREIVPRWETNRVVPVMARPAMGEVKAPEAMTVGAPVVDRRSTRGGAWT